MPEKDDKPTDVYHSFQEFCQRISKLKLPVGWSINISEFAYIKKSDNIHDLPQFEIIVDLNLAFKIRTFALFIPPDHDAYTTYKNSVKNITLTNLIKVLSSYKLCTGVENEIAKKSSTPHTVPHNINHCNISLNKPNMDEMKMQSNLVWNKHTGELIGYVDLGDTELNYATLEKTDKIVTHILTFLIRSIVNPFKIQSSKFRNIWCIGKSNVPLPWKAISICELNSLKVLDVTCDGASSNRKLFKMHFPMTNEDE